MNDTPMTMTQKILAAHAGKNAVHAGELIMAKLDLVLGNDITAPVAIGAFPQFGREKVFDRTKIALVPDHFAPNKDIKAATQCACMRAFAKEQQIANYFEVGHDCGVEHALLPEKGLVTAGDCIIGADSHTCTYGAVGAFSTGVGSTDMAAGMSAGETWFKVPSAIKVVVTGTPRRWVSGKDLILHLIGLIGVDGARYQSLEFTGDGIRSLSMDDRCTKANLASEAGVYERTIKIDLGTLKPTVAFPHLPENTHTVDSIDPITIDQVVIGSCTNGRLGDLRIAAEVMKGRKVAPGVRCIVIPATQRIWIEANREGLLTQFAEAGCVVSTPTCGPCLGGYMGILAKGEKCVATTNRNFVGRMGHVESEVYLASPAVAAASAVTGRITGPDGIC